MADDQQQPRREEPTTIDPYARSAESAREPPRGWWETLKHLGPGMILVGSIVGSGELIMTTKLGAEAGFVLLWFVLISCVIKVVVQAELVRHTISSGRTYLDVFNSLPGPRGRKPTWLTLSWLSVVVCSCVIGLALYTFLGQQSSLWSGGIAGFVIVFCGISAILIGNRQRAANRDDEVSTAADTRPVLNWFIWLWLVTVLIMFVNGGAILGGAGQALELAFPGLFGEGGARVWAVLVAVVTAALLLGGGYRSLEGISVGLVATFTLITVICTLLLQWTGFAITPEQIREGLTFDIPGPLTAGLIMTTLAMYAGTGIGTGEVSTYTYWCVEKGYARNAGARQPGPEWGIRARGWVRVMYIDVLLTMVVYTISTICFYFLGAAVLHAQGLNPEKTQTVAVLENIYTDSLGEWAATLFVVGAFVVLFSTTLSGVAGGTRILADGLCVMRIIDPRDYPARVRFTRIFVVISLVLHSLTYALFENPPMMLMISSLVAVALYPVIGLGTLYLRYREVDPRIVPGPLTTFWLWVCGLSLAVISPALALFALAVENRWITFSGG